VGDPSSEEVQLAWIPHANSADPSGRNGTGPPDQPNQKLIQAIIRAHRWTEALALAEFSSIEELATAVKLHPKVVRNEIRLAFLAPSILDSILGAESLVGLPHLRKISSLSWQKQLEELHQRHPENESPTFCQS
jgi:site-specific DNA recombinase